MYSGSTISNLKQSVLKELLNYNKDTGIFTWIVNRHCLKKGDKAGYINGKGYNIIKINGCKYLSHRLAFLYVNGYFPREQVDHINRIKTDNRWINLRDCCNSLNQANSPKQKNNKSGHRGVVRYKNKWIAVIFPNKKNVYLGIYENKIDAAIAYNEAAIKHFGKFASLNDVA